MITVGAVFMTATSGGIMAGVMTAAADTTGGDPFNYLTGLGFPGAIIILLVTGYLVPKPSVEDKNHQIEVLQQQNKELIQVLLQDTVPALTKATSVLEAFPQTENQVIRQLQNTSRKIDSLTRRLGDTEGD